MKGLQRMKRINQGKLEHVPRLLLIIKFQHQRVSKHYDHECS